MTDWAVIYLVYTILPLPPFRFIPPPPVLESDYSALIPFPFHVPVLDSAIFSALCTSSPTVDSADTLLRVSMTRRQGLTPSC